MSNKDIYLEVNDYLDLYLLAGSLGDKSWQREVIGSLQNHHNELSRYDSSLTLHSLWLEYKRVNMAILELYKQSQQHTFNHEFQEKIWILKQQRMDLSRKIHIEEGKSQRPNS